MKEDRGLSQSISWIHLFCLLFSVVCPLFFNGCAFLIRRPSYSVKAPAGAESPFRGVYHIHSEFSSDSKASLRQVLKTGEKSKLDFVLLTDHNNMRAKEAYELMKWPAEGGRPKQPLLITGIEISAPDGHMTAFGISEPPPKGMNSQDLIDWIHQKGGYLVLAHPICQRRPWTNWEIQGFDGLEVYNFAHTFYPENKLTLTLKAMLFTPKMFLKHYQKINPSWRQKWDELLMTEKVSAFAANDAHLHWKWLGIAPESYILQFQSVNHYVFSEVFEERALLEALGEGRSFFAFETRGEARDFQFRAEAGGKEFSMGEEVPGSRGEPATVRFLVSVPQDGELRLLHRGEIIAQAEGRALTHSVEKPGAYRVEVYKKDKPWIISNPIYVE